MRKKEQPRRLPHRVASTRNNGTEGFERMFEINPVACVVESQASDGARLIAVNPAFVALTGRPRSSLIGASLSELGLRVAPPESNPAKAGAVDAKPGQRHRMPTADGRELHLLVDVSPIFFQRRRARLHMIRDVTERCQVRGALRSSEARLSAIMNSIEVMIGETTVDGILTEVNDAALKACGTTRDAVIGRPFEQTAWFADLPASQASIVDSVARAGRGETVRHDLEFCTAGGQRAEADFMLVPRRDETGRVIGLIVSGIDVSARRRAEQAMRASEQRLRIRVDNIAGFIGEISVDGILLDVNRAALVAGGVSRDEEIGKSLEDTSWFCHSDEAREIARSAIATARRGETVRRDVEVRMSGGKLMPVDFMLAPVFDEHGQVSTLIPSAIDITERQAALQQLQRSRSLLEAALNQARMALWEFDPQTDRFTLSDRFYDLLATDARREGGYRLASSIYLREFCHPDERAEVVSNFIAAIKSAPTDRASTLAHRVIRRDGSVRHIASRFDIVRDAAGRATHLHGAIQDVTEQTMAAQQLRAQRDMQTMLSTAAAGLLGVPTSQMDGAIDEALRRCGDWLGADRSCLFVYSSDGQRMRLGHQWCRDGIPACLNDMQVVAGGLNPWLRQQLETVGLVVLSDVASLPADAAAERADLQLNSVRSMIAIPLHTKGRISGFIGFQSIRQTRNWTISDGALLKVLGEIVGSALNRQRAERALHLLAEISASDGEGTFIAASVEALARAMGTRMALVAIRDAQDDSKATTLACWDTDHIGANFTYELPGSPCEKVNDNAPCVYADRVAERFPKDRWLIDNGIVSYVGVPLIDENDVMIGHLALLDNQPLTDDAEILNYVKLYAARISAEMIRRRADEALRLSETGLRATLDSTRDGILAVDSRGLIRFGNQRMAEMWRVPVHMFSSTVREGDLLQAAADQLRDPQAFLDDVQEIYSSESASQGLLEFSDGRVFERYSKPLLEDGAIVGRVWSFSDVTADKQMAAALQRSRNQLDQAMDLADMAAWELNLVDQTLHWNDRFYALFGTTAEQEGGYRMSAPRYLDEFCHPEDAHLVEQAIAEAVTNPDTGRSYSCDYRIIRRDTSAVREVTMHYRIACDAYGRPVRAWGAMQDATERRQITRKLAHMNVELEQRVEDRTAALRDQQAAARMMLENLSDGVVACDSSGALTLFNKRAREWYGCDPLELTTDAWSDHFEIRSSDGSARLALDQHPLTRARAGEMVRDFEMQIRRRGGEPRPVVVNGGPIFDDFGVSLGAMIAIHDVSERTRQIEDRLARERAEQASRAKSGFLAAMSHEIRTPMNAVLGLVEVLGCSALTPHQADLVATIGTSAGQLLRLIDDILDFSKIEAGRLELEHAPLALAPLVEGVVKTLATFAEQKQVSLRLFIAPSVPASVLGDETALRQVIYNLLGNAVKFSTGLGERVGRVELRLEPDRRIARLLRLTIRDNGIGMAPEVVDKLFLPFVQGEGSTTRRFGGTGLGLAICSRIVGLMGGSIEATSTAGSGSTFTVNLPYQLNETPNEASVQTLVGVICFIVDGEDTYDAADLQVYLESAGAEVRRLDSDQAGRLATSAAFGAHHDARPVLIRPQGPHAIGRSEISMVLIGNGRRRRPRQLDQHTVCVDADSLCIGELLSAVEIAVGRKPSPEAERPNEHGLTELIGTAAAPFAGHVILVAEDDLVNQKVISHQLHQLGHVAQIAADGAEALRLWRTGCPALLLADLHMPMLDGYELTSAIRAEERERGKLAGIEPPRLPILALTANALRGEEHQAYALGMDAYLTKPISLAALQQKLLQWLPAPAPNNAAPPRPESGPASDPAEALLELHVPMRLVGDDPQMLHELLADYVEATDGMVVSLQQAAADGDCATARSIAHNFKSSARTVGAFPLGTLCAEIEGAGQSGDPVAVARCVGKLLLLHRRVIDVVNDILSGRNAR